MSKYKSSRSSNSHHPIKVFVGSIPANTDEKELLVFLRSHANVLSLTLAKAKKIAQKDESSAVSGRKAAKGPARCKGFGFATCATQLDADALLSLDSQLRLGDRVLTFRHFKEGQDLRRDVDNFNARRLFIGDIPAAASVAELKQVFSCFGGVHNLYLVNDDQSRKSKFGYVIYDSLEAADLALEAASAKRVQVGARPLRVERFDLSLRSSTSENQNKTPLCDLGSSRSGSAQRPTGPTGFDRNSFLPLRSAAHIASGSSKQRQAGSLLKWPQSTKIEAALPGCCSSSGHPYFGEHRVPRHQAHHSTASPLQSRGLNAQEHTQSGPSGLGLERKSQPQIGVYRSPFLVLAVRRNHSDCRNLRMNLVLRR
jgi:RNA recognition motif. (a.k.a. RRM, RBD, or RNP domain)